MPKTFFDMPTAELQAGLPLNQYHFGAPVGNVFYVGSTVTGAENTASRGKTPGTALATIDYAVGLCTASQGDIIIVLPGHIETITAAAGLDLDVAGITIIGSGEGRNKPKIIFTTAATADMDVDAANITLENFFIDCTGVDSLNAAIDVNAANFTLRKCEIEISDATGQCDIVLTADATGATRLVVEGCYFHGAGDSTVGIAIDMVGGDDVMIRDNVFDGYFGTTGAIQNATTAGTNLNIIGNTIVNRTADGNNKVIVVDGSTVAVIVNNRGSVIDSMSPAPVTAAAGFVAGNYFSTAAGVTASVLM